MPDWLGSGRLNKNEEYWPYEKARDFVHKLDLKNSDEWLEYSQSDEKWVLSLQHLPMRIKTKVGLE